jgi:hypothetical protein
MADEANARLTNGGKATAYLLGTEITAKGGCILEFYDANGERAVCKAPFIKIFQTFLDGLSDVAYGLLCYA